MKKVVSLVVCISFTTFAMRHAPMRAMAIRHAAPKPATAQNHSAHPPAQAEFLTSEHKACLMQIGSERYKKFSPETCEKMAKTLETLPKCGPHAFAYNNALMTLAQKSAYFKNLEKGELMLAKRLLEAGANPNYSVEVPENDCFGSMDGVSASAPCHYRTETLLTWAKGNLKMLLEQKNDKSKL